MSNNPTTKDIIKAILTNNSLNEEEKASLVEELMNEIKKEYPDLKYHATKSDVKEVELKLTKEIKELDLKLSKEIKETKVSMIKWSFLFWITQFAALIAILYKIL